MVVGVVVVMYTEVIIVKATRPATFWVVATAMLVVAVGVIMAHEKADETREFGTFDKSKRMNKVIPGYSHDGTGT